MKPVTLKSMIALLFLLFSMGSNAQETRATIKTTVKITPSQRYQTMEGWGVSLCWWANMVGKWNDENKIDELVDWLVSPSGLNMNVFRYNIGGGDDPEWTNCSEHHFARGKGIRAEIEGFKDSSASEYLWNRDASQRKIMLKIKEKRPDAIFEAFSNSAPYYMTYSGCCAGATNANSDNLKPEYYEEFAHYLVDVCKMYKDSFGIEFKTLEPFNEPMTNYWGANGGQEGCHFGIVPMIQFTKVLYPILKASGLNTVIAATDETKVAQSVTDFNTFKSDTKAMSYVEQWNTHTYEADNTSRERLYNLAKDNNKVLWMSETGHGGVGLQGNLELAQTMISDMNHLHPQVWCDWQYVEEGTDQWCLVRGDFANQTYQKVMHYYVRQNVTKYIKKGYTIIGSNDEQTLAAVNPGGDSLIIVVLNNTDDMKTTTIDLTDFGARDTTANIYSTDSMFKCARSGRAKLTSGILTASLLNSHSINTIVVPIKNAATNINGELTECNEIKVFNDKGILVGHGTSLRNDFGSLSKGIYYVCKNKTTEKVLIK